LRLGSGARVGRRCSGRWPCRGRRSRRGILGTEQTTESTDVVDSAASVPFVCRGGFADRGTTPARHCGAQTPLTSGDDLRSLEIILFDFPVEALAVDA